MTKENKFRYAIICSFLLYFLILIGERMQSVIQTFTHSINPFSKGFDIFVYFTIFTSFLAFLLFFILKCRDSLSILVKPTDEKLNNYSFTNLVIASGLILLSGMVHSYYTISGIQFASYGVYILGILLIAIMNHKRSENKALLWLSFAYLVCYSMAIPVTYESFLNHSTFIHILEGIGSYILVFTFTLMAVRLFKGENDLFNLMCIIPAIILDALIVGLEWNGTPNMFVLIFIIISTLLFVSGVILKMVQKRK